MIVKSAMWLVDVPQLEQGGWGLGDVVKRSPTGGLFWGAIPKNAGT